jgi:hypothetical protein
MTVTPAVFNFNVYRNGDVRQDVIINVDGVILNLAGYIAQMEVRPSLTDSATPLININSTAPTTNLSQIYITAATYATGVLTSSANYGTSDTVTIGTRVYHFVASPAVDGDVRIAGSESASITNLANAINNSGGIPGTDYVVTAADPNVTAVAAAHTLTVTALNTLTAAQANSVATTDAMTTGNGVWGHVTLTGGVDSKLQIFIDDRDMTANFPLATVKTGFITYVYDLLLTAPGGEPSGDVDPYLTGNFVVNNGVTR